MLTCPEKLHVDCDILTCGEKVQAFYSTMFS